MATYNTTLYAAQDEDRVNTARLPRPNQAGGGVQMAVVPYTIMGGDNDQPTEASGDFVNLCVLPAGAIPIPGLSFVDAQSPGTGLVVDVGYASDVDALGAGIVLTGGGHKAFTSTAIPDLALTPTALAPSDTTIVAKLVTVDTPTGGNKLVFHIAYKVAA